MEYKDKDVGILLVHGVGEQRRFEHLEGELRSIVRSISAHPNVKQVSVTTRSSQDAAYLAEQVTWKAEDAAPVIVQVRFHDTTDVRTLEFREVWWADLDERNTLWSQVKFWFWGLAQWAEVGYEKNTRGITDLEQKMTLPKPPSGKRPISEWLIIRTKLFLVAVFFSLVLLTLSLINFVLARFLKGRIPGPDIISSYVGDVKLLLQDEREGKGPVYDLGLPPRVSVRRRMVNALVEMATSGYERWYVAAHSLGTVVAFNGLMETDHALPNYLDQDKWEQYRDHRMRGPQGNDLGSLGGVKEGEDATVKKMMPRRPTWLKKDDVIYRHKLFCRLQGIITYGSPLDKFSALWGAIVGINNSPAFQPSCEWINVFDENDPIAGALNDFGDYQNNPVDEDGRIHARPRNFAFSASPLLLISHLRYLTYKPKDRDPERSRLVNRLADWFLAGGSFPAPEKGTSGWQEGGPRAGRYIIHFFQWAIVGLALASLLGWILSALGSSLTDGEGGRLWEQIMEAITKAQSWLWNAGASVWVGLSAALIIVFIAGVFRGLRNKLRQ